MAVFNPIPDPVNEINSLYLTVKALKNTIEQLTDVTNQQGSPNQVFISRTTPTAVKVGDMWVKNAVLKGETVILSTWDGQRWIRII